MTPLHACRLYAFVDTAYMHGRDPADVARQLADGGADLIQLRAKGSSPKEMRKMAETILSICQQAGIWFVVNDSPTIAADVGAPLCHLGQEDFFDGGHRHCSEISERYPGLHIGLSTHSPEQAERAVAAAPAYIAIGPVYPTRTKPGRKAATLEYVRWAAANVKTPWFAIGGINLQNVDDVLAAGAARIAVVSAILSSGGISRACKGFKARLLAAPDVPG